MKFSTVATFEKRKQADLLAIPFWKVKKKVEAASTVSDFKAYAKVPLELKDFKGSEGEIVTVYPQNGNKEKRYVLLGLGDKDKLTVESLRRAYAKLVSFCQSKKDVKDLNLLLPQGSELTENSVAQGVAEGLLLSNYSFDKLKHDSLKKDPAQFIEKVIFIGASKKELAIANKAQAICEGVYTARDLVNGNADDVTPQTLASTARSLAKKFPSIKTTVFDKKRIEKEGMDLLLAVSRGAAVDPAFIIMEYKGAPKSKETTVVVGKGVTYDTGGLNLKPTGSMETMKSDMSGSATAFGTIVAAATMGLKANVTAVVAATENGIDSNSYKPGDVYSSYSGKTVEIGNTDAEGRLTLADALAYSVKKLSPTRVVNFATLTGAMVIALGSETTGMMTNDESLAEKFSEAGEATFERVWRLPLFKEYRDQLKSDIADINNIGGRDAGSITAGIFLQEFVEKTPWVHFDIAGTAYLSKARRYNPKRGTGVGVRLMIEFLENLGKKTAKA